jgi:uracil-DNA glycosylase
MASFSSLLGEVRRCTICAEHLPFDPRPILQLHPHARILIAGQAPGRKVNDSGVPFADASGDRLREWLGLSPQVFYDPQQVAILPMGFCFPGTGKAGDLPPRPECAPEWREKLLRYLKNLKLTLVIGQYAQAYHLPDAGTSVTSTVQSWRKYWPSVVPLPHPSPRNNIWLSRNPWFEKELLPHLQTRIARMLKAEG